ncbi:glycosyltransferase family 4 protein [Streptococcus suis]|uniref:Glycosyltransferase n=1 Tax=Streptococcus suis TaxID=1307 RepID=A0A0F6UVR8_STRSU|nr:glycosyltransferase family 4 protein [Streptococcus suis]AKE79199.1 glycosyltransferase [Streptococcus suis]AKE79224.1 glycosyltransferase [Streptococcus suis]AKE79249.1 glycosyltransferase [Streptococcus suis]AKE79274.1 glycosyltransferase [Streptococcus suis]AKE79299.1 glycosyltransferase [Streptococcus suis]
MKIVHVEDFFHPDAGYQINILPKYLAKFGHEQTIITSEMEKIPSNVSKFFGTEDIGKRDKIYEEKYHVKIIRLPLLGFMSGRAIFSRNLISVIQDISPDVLYIHGNDTLTGIRLLRARKKLSCQIVTDSHMLEMASRNPFNTYFRKFYKTFITPILLKEGIPVIRTQNDNYVEKHLGIPLIQAPWISYGSDIDLFQRDEKVKEKFRTKHQISPSALVCVYAGKLDECKGGLFLAESLKERFQTKRPLVFVIVGNTSDDYGRKVEQAFSESQNLILRFPTQKYEDLAVFFKIADFALFPKQCSLSFYDVQACGLPVLLEDNTVNIDRVSHENGWIFKEDSKDSLREQLTMIASLDEAELERLSQNSERYILEQYNYESQAREYEEIIESVVLKER